MPDRSRLSLPSRAALVIALATLAPAARAQNGEEPRVRADALFREGQQLMSAGQVPTACEKLEESQRLDPKLGRLLNLAYCHERLGRTATAWSEYNQAAALASQTRQAEREAFARKQASQLALGLSFVQLDMAAAPDVSQVALDGSPLGREQWVVPFPIDPGVHTLTFGAPGFKPGSQTVHITAAGTSRLAISPLEREPAVVPSTPPEPVPPPAVPAVAPVLQAVPPAPDSPQPQPAGAPPRASNALGWIVGGAGVVGLGIGAAFGMRAISLKGDADLQCRNHLCTPQGVSHIEDAKAAATVSTVGLAAGVVGIGVGAWLLLRAPAPTAKQARVAPYVASDRAGVALYGAW
jgi:hypothetical protein